MHLSNSTSAPLSHQCSTQQLPLGELHSLFAQFSTGAKKETSMASLRLKTIIRCASSTLDNYYQIYESLRRLLNRYILSKVCKPVQQKYLQIYQKRVCKVIVFSQNSRKWKKCAEPFCRLMVYSIYLLERVLHMADVVKGLFNHGKNHVSIQTSSCNYYL